MFIYWPHPTPVGIRVEEISGMESKSGRLWEEMAKQIYCENGRDVYREIGHFPNGAPFLFGQTTRISITHSGHLLAVASLPKTPEADLARFAPRTALGIDAERNDREQVLKIRDRFLSDTEKELIPADDLEANIIAWTAKEALYKAGMTEGLDLRRDITILSLPHVDRKMNLPGAPAPVIGRAVITLPSSPAPSPEVTATSPEVRAASPETPAVSPETPATSPEASVISPEVRAASPEAPAVSPEAPVMEGIFSENPARKRNPGATSHTRYEMELYTYESETETETYIVTLAYSPKCAKYSRK